MSSSEPFLGTVRSSFAKGAFTIELQPVLRYIGSYGWAAETPTPLGFATGRMPKCNRQQESLQVHSATGALTNDGQRMEGEGKEIRGIVKRRQVPTAPP